MINIEWLLEQGPCKNFASGDYIPAPSAKDGENKAMYILLSGRIDVYGKSAAGGTKKISTIIAGDVFCGREFFIGAADNTYRAVDNVTVYLLTRESFNDLSWSQPDILFEIMRSAYMPPRPPVSSTPPIKSIAEQAREAELVKAAAKGSAPAASGSSKAVDEEKAAEEFRAAARARVIAQAKAIGQEKAGDGGIVGIPIGTGDGVFPAGHKIYTGKEYPMNEKLIYPKEYTCPFCRKTFRDFRIFRSKLNENPPMRFDLRKIYPDFNSEWYDLITCQHCFFTTFNTYFTEPKPLKRDAIDAPLDSARSKILIDFSAPRDINTVFSMHYLALICCEGYPSLNMQLQARIWSNLSWLYEDAEDKEMECFAADKASEIYEQLFMSGHLTPSQEQAACLSIAGMQHRAGIDRNLKRYLYTAKMNNMGDKLYIQLADEFMKELGIGDEPLEIMTK